MVMEETHRVLVAVSPPSQGKLRALLEECEADFFESYGEATAALERRSYSSAVVGLHFGEPRMFDFVREVKRRQSAARIVCVQGTAGQLREGALASARTALQLLGAQGVIDLSRLSEEDCRTLAGLLRSAAFHAHS